MCKQINKISPCGVFLVAVASFFFAACSTSQTGGLFSPRYVINSHRIASELLPYFPYQQNIQNVASLSLRNPTISMAPNLNKVRLGLSVQAATNQNLAQLTGITQLSALAGRKTTGICQLVCGLRYERSNRSIYLEDPVVESLTLDNLTPAVEQSVIQLINTLGPRLLDRHPVYTLKDEPGAAFLKAIRVQSNGVALHLGL